MFKRLQMTYTLIVALALFASPGIAAAAFNSGSTGADGAFSPTQNTQLQLPPNGIFNFTSVNIPSGVTVSFARNALNTPVTILASGDVTIAGTINVSGSNSPSATTTLEDYTTPGRGGPGGFDGGRGGNSLVVTRGGDGLGPGGGRGATRTSSDVPQGGGGGGYRAAGQTIGTGTGGAAYGSSVLVPLLGGSGGGGGTGSTTDHINKGTGGGGGGGAILIAVSGSLNFTGSILARGGTAGSPNSSVSGFSNMGGCGGGGSGGAIRIVASNIVGNGALNVSGGGTCSPRPNSSSAGGVGGAGWVRTEVATSGTLIVTGFPTLRISSVAGIEAPAVPTGEDDITLPADLSNPVPVVLTTTGVPLTNTVRLTVTPLRALKFNINAPPLTGSLENATTTVEVDLPTGQSTLFATTSYTIVASLGDALGVRFANGERVESVMLTASLGGESMVTLITVSGKEYTVPAALMVGIVGG